MNKTTWSNNGQPSRLPTVGTTIAICNLMGQTLQSRALPARIGETDLSHTQLSPGMYLIQLRDAQGRLLASRKVRKY